MPELLHTTECACHDCWSRRLIRDSGPAPGPYCVDELEDFGHFQKEQKLSQEDD